MIKKMQEYTSTEKGLIYINSLAILAQIVFLFLMPIIASLAGLRFIMYFATITLLVINIAFYIGPASIKGRILQ
jgi:hypothetical protein